MDKRDRASSRRERKNEREKVTKISIQGIPKRTERLAREKCPKSQRRGISLHGLRSQQRERSCLTHQHDFCDSGSLQELTETEQVALRREQEGVRSSWRGMVGIRSQKNQIFQTSAESSQQLDSERLGTLERGLCAPLPGGTYNVHT